MPDFEPPAGAFLRLLAEHWEGVLILLGPEAAENVTALLAGGADSDDPFDVLALVSYEVLPKLPAKHPLQRVLNSGFRFRPGAGPDVVAEEREARASLAWFASNVLASRALSAPAPGAGARAPSGPDGTVVLTGLPTGPELSAAARRRLSALPAGPGPAGGRRPGLIRLPSPAGDLVPAFQFDPGQEPWPVVVEVNLILDAEHDPWGVADWWVQPHAWLSVSPAQLLGSGADDRLRLAARSLVED